MCLGDFKVHRVATEYNYITGLPYQNKHKYIEAENLVYSVEEDSKLQLSSTKPICSRVQRDYGST